MQRTGFYHPEDEGGLAWNYPEIGVKWPGVVGEYNGTASADGDEMEEGTKMVMSENDQKWSTLL